MAAAGGLGKLGIWQLEGWKAVFSVLDVGLNAVLNEYNPLLFIRALRFRQFAAVLKTLYIIKMDAQLIVTL